MRARDHRRTPAVAAPSGAEPVGVQPVAPSASMLLSLQRAGGNRAALAAVQRMMASHSTVQRMMDEDEDEQKEEALEPLPSQAGPGQPLITQFFGAGAGGPAPAPGPGGGGGGGGVAPVVTSDGDAEFTARIGGVPAGALTLYWDEEDERYYLNNIETQDAFRRRGVATALIRAAIAAHGAIYAMQGAWQDDGDDTRGLTGDGQRLVTALVGTLPGLRWGRPGDDAEGDDIEGDDIEGDEED